tara:strand:- start:1920 stop:2732 length:813 start_codon:yes stop_codon:yes gene_type:complete
MKKNYLSKFNLQNKKVFVVGGSGLLGSEITELLLENSATVVNLDLSNKKNILTKKKLSKNYFYQKFDISDIENLDKNIDLLIKKFGCPNVFINSSYPVTSNWNLSSFKKNKISNLRKNVDIHQNSYCWSAHKICQKMKEKKILGSVVLLNSIYGFLGQNMSLYKNTNLEENMNYSIIKGAILNFSRQLASFYGSSGIRINSVCSGGVKGHIKGSSIKQDKNFIKNYSKNCPLGRLALPNEIAHSVLFLASEASSYITGTSLVVDGGWSAI